MAPAFGFLALFVDAAGDFSPVPSPQNIGEQPA